MSEHEPTEEKKPTGPFKVTKKGFYFTWAGMTGLVTTVMSTGLMSGGLLHQSLFGSSQEISDSVKISEKRGTDNSQRISILEQRFISLEQIAADRDQHIREDIHDIRVAITHLSDHLK